MKRFFLAFCLALLGVFLVGGLVRADSSEEVIITARGYVCGMPGDFTLTYISDYEVGISWTVGEDADETMVRAAFGRVPQDIDDGYQVYRGTGNNCTDTALSLSTPEVVGYAAWSWNATMGAWNPLFASADTGGFMSASFLFIGLIGIACFFTWFASRRREILIAFAAALVWLALAFWLLLGDVTNLALTDPWAQIVAWVFVIMTFVPFLAQMNVEIRREAGGTRWTEYGRPPKGKPSAYEEYKERLFRRTRR